MSAIGFSTARIMNNISRIKFDAKGNYALSEENSESKESLCKDKEIKLNLLKEKTIPNKFENDYFIGPISFEPLKDCDGYQVDCCGALYQKSELLYLYKINKDLSCPLCRGVLKVRDLFDQNIIKQEKQKTKVFWIAFSAFIGLFVIDAGLATIEPFVKIPYYNDITCIGLTLISILGMIFSTIIYSNNNFPLESGN